MDTQFNNVFKMSYQIFSLTFKTKWKSKKKNQTIQVLTYSSQRLTECQVYSSTLFITVQVIMCMKEELVQEIEFHPGLKAKCICIFPPTSS